MDWRDAAHLGLMGALLPQGLWLRRTALRLPPAAGPTHGLAGAEGPQRQLLAFGDSIIAGVGVANSTGALPAQLAGALARHAACRVAWRAIGLNGARLPQLLQRLQQGLDTSEVDWVLISVGVNHVTALGTGRAWCDGLRCLLEGLHARLPMARIVLAGIPDLGAFPALPTPLRQLLGWRARQLDRLGTAVCTSVPGCAHLPTPVVYDPSAYAEDGFHPNSASCALWADSIARAVLDTSR